MNTNYQTPFAALGLERFPLDPNDRAQKNLQAWDSADTLLLEHLAAIPLATDAKVLILNDNFGALTCALSAYSPEVQSDSFLSRVAIEKNFERNAVKAKPKFLESMETPQAQYDYVFLRIPKSLNLLEHQLYMLRECVTAKTQVVACSMAKSLSKNTRAMFESILGSASQSLAQRKARLIHCTPEPDIWKGQSPFPTSYTHEGISLLNHANVFAQNRVDPGTHIFLQHLDKLPQAESVLDLACGNGVMGIFAAKHSAATTLYACDESYMAIASAKHNIEHTLPNIDVVAEVDNGIPQSFPSVDLIINNPPFHQQHTMGSQLARSMFKDAAQHLKEGGEFWVIANRHLNYHMILKPLFGNCSNIGQHPKYVLLRCVKHGIKELEK